MSSAERWKESRLRAERVREVAVYFEVLEYTSDNLRVLSNRFDLRRLSDPSALTDEVLAEAELLFAPLGYRFEESLFRRCPKLRVVATNTTGVPHIDVEAARRQGITVISLQDAPDFLETITPTAELTLGLIIAITRNILPAHRATLEGRWRRWDFGGPAMLSRMCLGVVGLGRLGGMVARWAAAIGASVSFYDPFRKRTSAAEAVYTRHATLHELVASSDVVTIHVPMSEANRHMFSERVFAAFKPGAYFVNTARGELVDTQALIEALERGHVGGAALDVLDGEFDPEFASSAAAHPLVEYAKKHDNVIITPHIGGSTRDAWGLTQRYTIERAIEAVQGKRHAQ